MSAARGWTTLSFGVATRDELAAWCDFDRLAASYF